MSFNGTQFIHQANGGNNAAAAAGIAAAVIASVTRNGVATPVQRAKSTKSQNPVYVKHSAQLRQMNMKRGQWWGAGLMGFWALLVLVSSIEHLGSRFFPNAMMKWKQAMARSPMARLWRKHVTMPALLNNKHTTRNIVGGVLPTRFESLTLFCYFVLIVIGEAVNYSYYSHDTYWTEKRQQISRYVGDRSAIMTMFILIPTYLFAGRKNFLLWLTGWKMSTFYAFHKWLARMAIFSAFVHTITMLINSYWIKKIHTRKYTKWWRWGSVAMVCGGIILFQSAPLIRTRMYDVFLYGHIVLACFFLIGVWIHTQTLGYGEYAYSIAAVWCFDRFMRFMKISQFGLRLAHIKLVSEDILVMTVPSVLTLKKPSAGSFGYVYFLEGWNFFQSHPFSVIQEDNGDIKLLIRVKNGITKKVYSRLLNNPDQMCYTRVAIEGFYGEYKPAFSYDQVIMIGGGNGVVGLYEYVKDIAQKKKDGKCNVKFVKFYWTVRHWHSIEWLLPELLKLKEFDFVQPIVYVTRQESRGKGGERLAYALDENPSTPSDRSQDEIEVNEEGTTPEPDDKEETKIKADIVGVTAEVNSESDLPHVEFRSSRPNVAELLHEDINELDSSDNIMVMSCAHNNMCDDVRKSVACEVGEQRIGRIDLAELLQVW
ncbi:ZYBA0S08-00298g1_1 [Zygosaccharomyces bailii CLIB 213]|uniref:ZYBA0S08-00298g1_1 n=1 Tax=Zygosaccharomyces bailii (strain CLIB 213 / ATCC 58445 / CBS 680 / BCRC 21525 / NBRC 1098 / NCYC 1416 / NRRL Y-2227) TaxID=1333698 RepID=A0A8J2T8D9_ZYGB2|nr:ZYBA0S08-00298g1_1 [Zygosaccharomyces bailii CLIB 213]